VEVRLHSLVEGASIPVKYISDSHQRVEVYRKLAQIVDNAAAEALQTELRDRFGPLPPQVELLLEVAALKVLASQRGVTAIEVKEDKVMLTRNNDYLMIEGKFPRLTKKGTKAQINEIKRWVRVL
jgi:transcription-repair coupling factor (superfamily II helicase)